MRRLMKGLHRGEKGFTLIELLIVIAILGIIAAVVIPNAAGFMITGTLNAANTEAANVKTGAVGYYAEHSAWPADSTVLDFSNYYTGTLKAKYTFDTDGSDVGAGLIKAADPGAAADATHWGPKITWDKATQVWKRA